MILRGRKTKYSKKKTYVNATSSTTNPTRTGLKSNLGLRRMNAHEALVE
jgi:hypothetical protein